MTDEEIDRIADRVIEKMETKRKHEVGLVFSKVRNKWFKDEHGNYQLSRMGRILNNRHVPCAAGQMWDLVRKMTCIILGVRDVRNVQDSVEANRTAEVICRVVYGLAKERKEHYLQGLKADVTTIDEPVKEQKDGKDTDSDSDM